MATNPKKSDTQISAEASVAKVGQISEAIAKTLNTLIKYGTLAIVFYCIKDIVASLAGKETISSFSLNSKLLADLNSNPSFTTMVSLLFGTGGVTYGFAQRRLRRKEISHLSPRREELEKIIDPGRHSSKLTKNGTTRPEDL